MWNDYNAQSGGGGGFFNSPNQFGGADTPANKAKNKGKRNSRTAPVVISQALKSSDDGFKIWGFDIQIVCIVAKVCDIKVQSTKIVYTIQDITGRMNAMLWVDQDSSDGEDKTIPNVMVNTYVQIFGNIKTNQGKNVIVIFKMFNVTNMNAVTFHYLHCINNRIKMEARAEGAKCNADSNVGMAAMPANSFMPMDTGSASGLNPRQTMVYNLIRAAKLEEGMSKEDIQTALRDKMSKTELEKILEWMCGEGHIYSTIDEDHFRATDAS